MNHANELIELAKSSGLTYAQIAEAVGVTREGLLKMRKRGDAKASTIADLEKLVDKAFPLGHVVYALQFSYEERQLVKIGHSTNWPARLRNLCRSYVRLGARIESIELYFFQTRKEARKIEERTRLIMEDRCVTGLPKPMASREIFEGYNEHDRIALRSSQTGERP